MSISIARLREHASNALPLPLRRRWSPQASPSGRDQRTLRDHRYGLVYCVSRDVPAVTLPAFAGYPLRLPTGMAQAGSAPRWFTRHEW